jgi:hypothetical protein
MLATTKRCVTVRVEGVEPVAEDWEVFYDYSKLIKLDTTFAAIFRDSHFAPTQLEQTTVTVVKALMRLVAAETKHTALLESSTILGANVELVKTHRKELYDVNIRYPVEISKELGRKTVSCRDPW